MKYKSALITGGAGFIGSHLAQRLLQQGCRVTVVDDLSTGEWGNIDPLAANPKFRAIISPAEDAEVLAQEVPRHDVIYHLASAVGVKLVIDKPVRTIETIYNATDAVLGACSRYRRPFLLTSTSEVYGKSTSIPFREDHDVVLGATSKRRWAYACAKMLDEFLALAHHYQTQLPVFVVRLFNTVGPRQKGRYGMVLPSFVRQAISGVPLTVYGDGNQRRCFCSVYDVVDGLVKVPTVPEAIGQIVNLGTDEEISILDLAERVKAICRSDSTIQIVPYEEAYGPGFDDMDRRVPSLERARRLVGWSPRWNIDGIITEVAEHIRAEGAS